MAIWMEKHERPARLPAGFEFEGAEHAPQEKRLNDLGQEIIEINRENGWNVTTPEDWKQPYKIPAVLALIHSEVSEALEGFRHDDAPNFAEELADVLIRVLDCSAGLGIDMDAAVAEKLEKNKKTGISPWRQAGLTQGG